MSYTAHDSNCISKRPSCVTLSVNIYSVSFIFVKLVTCPFDTVNEPVFNIHVTIESNVRLISKLVLLLGSTYTSAKDNVLIGGTISMI